jgi:hypothetical protein
MAIVGMKRICMIFVLSSLARALMLAAVALAARKPETSSEIEPAPKPPFTDYRFETPGQIHKITSQDLPAPFDTPSASNGPTIVPRPQGTWPKAPAGFEVTLYATGHVNPRRIRRAPNGDLFVGETETGKVEIFRGIDGADTRSVQPFLPRVWIDRLAWTSIRQDPIHVGSTWEPQEQSFASFIATGICKHAARPNTSSISQTTATIAETFYLNLTVEKC